MACRLHGASGNPLSAVLALISGSADMKKSPVTIETIRAEFPILAAEKAALLKKRQALALPALNQDSAAISAMAEIDASLAKNANRVLTLADAIAALEAIADEQRLAAEKAARIAQANRIDDATAERIAANQALDRALAGMADALLTWLQSADPILAAGCPDAGMRTHQAATAAIYHAIAAKFPRVEMSRYFSTLRQIFEPNSLGENHWQPVARDELIHSAKNHAASLRTG